MDAKNAKKEKINKRRRELYAANKDKINERRRQHYAANKVEINKRRRQDYAEKKQLLQRSKSKSKQNTTVPSSSVQHQNSALPNENGIFYANVSTSEGNVGTASNQFTLQVNVPDCANCNTSMQESNSQQINLNVYNKGNFTSSEFESSNNRTESCRQACQRQCVEHSIINFEGSNRIYENIIANVTQLDSGTLVLPKVPSCKHCGAYKFYRESDMFCCSGGQIRLAETILPQYMVELITGTDARSKDFQNMIRTYNNHFAFTSIGMSCDENYQRRDQGIYTVRVQGQVHHYLNDLIPNVPFSKLKGIQFYFYDPKHQVSNRMSALPRLDPVIVDRLVKLLESNPYAEFLKQASELDNIDQYHIVIRSEPDIDQRVYNKPTSTEVAGIWIEDESGESGQSNLWDIRVYTKSGRSHKVQYYYGCYDPLQYVLMFPNGEPGWHGKIPKIGCPRNRGRTNSHLTVADCNSFEDVLEREQSVVSLPTFDDLQPATGTTIMTSTNRKRKNVSCREYYVYKLQIRENDRSYILQFGRLLQQYVIDNYIKIESMRLDYHRNKQKQKKLRREHYQGLVDSVISGIEVGSKVGTRIYLPATFIGGPRDMRHRYLDSMALVQEYGKPDLFITMTCNPNWPEIKDLLSPGEEAHNRPDLLARVFKVKLSILYDLIMSGKIFGKVASIVHVIEFQKRGLPHAHFLIILKPMYKNLTPESYDRIVSAELPNKFDNPHLYSFVVKHMMHGPCGNLNPQNVCIKDGKCKNHYPKEFTEYTSHGKGSYPIYRRRNNGRIATVRGHILDNRWVIPYNPTLLLLFNCHINVEICCDIRAVKYLYKYVHKGHDKVMFRVAPDISGSDIDEIADFQNGRWVSPVEACWRIFGFPLHGMYPSVVQLQVHLPNFQSIQFEDDADLERIVQDEKQQQTMLTEFFKVNASTLEAKKLNLLYKEFPKHYVWDGQSRMWSKRKKGYSIGRLCVVNPVENERYYLRVLLNNVRCPISFDSLLIVNDKQCKTFQEAAYERGLLHNDDDIEKCLHEASMYRMPSELRRLFATLLHYCKPSNPKKLFDMFFDQMAEDFRRIQAGLNLSERDIQKKVLQGINDTLESVGRDVNEYRLVPFDYVATEFERYTREINAEKSIPVPEEDLQAVHKLTAEQKKVFDVIIDHAMSDTGGVFFVDGPGGTGKSFLYKVLLAHIRSKGYIGIIVASSGIASSGFLGGRTAHSRFKIPINTGPAVQCQISFQSCEADLIRSSKIIIWDEAPMADKSAILAVDKLLQDLCKNTKPFGNKLVVFGGDFRQVLPVVKGGGKAEQIEASIVSSTLWSSFTKLKLTDNMRARHDPEFVEFLMRIGNGEEPINADGKIEIPQPMLIPYTTMEKSIEALISAVYPDVSMFAKDPFYMMQRAILCPKNEFVDDINAKLIERIPGKAVVYISDDRAKNFKDQGDYVDYLNSLEPRGLPQHRLILKVNSPVILLRNINPVEGLCNGTRLICKHLTTNLVGAVIATGQFRGKHVWIPRIPLEPNPSDNKYCIPFVRRQIPLKLCFAMTINKSQGQTLDYVGVYLRHPVFTHGQLYVALSRAKTGENVKILIIPSTCSDPGTKYTTNVVYKEVLLKASLT